MRYLITKLFRSTSEGYSEPVAIKLEREGGTVRAITGHIGSPGTNGEHVTELNGSGAVIITMDANTTLSIQPLG